MAEDLSRVVKILVEWDYKAADVPKEVMKAVRELDKASQRLDTNFKQLGGSQAALAVAASGALKTLEDFKKATGESDIRKALEKMFTTQPMDAQARAYSNLLGAVKDFHRETGKRVLQRPRFMRVIDDLVEKLYRLPKRMLTGQLPILTRRDFERLEEKKKGPSERKREEDFIGKLLGEAADYPELEEARKKFGTYTGAGRERFFKEFLENILAISEYVEDSPMIKEIAKLDADRLSGMVKRGEISDELKQRLEGMIDVSRAAIDRGTEELETRPEDFRELVERVQTDFHESLIQGGRDYYERLGKLLTGAGRRPVGGAAALSKLQYGTEFPDISKAKRTLENFRDQISGLEYLPKDLNVHHLTSIAEWMGTIGRGAQRVKRRVIDGKEIDTGAVEEVINQWGETEYKLSGAAKTFGILGHKIFETVQGIATSRIWHHPENLIALAQPTHAGLHPHMRPDISVRPTGGIAAGDPRGALTDIRAAALKLAEKEGIGLEEALKRLDAEGWEEVAMPDLLSAERIAEVRKQIIADWEGAYDAYKEAEARGEDMDEWVAKFKDISIEQARDLRERAEEVAEAGGAPPGKPPTMAGTDPEDWRTFVTAADLERQRKELSEKLRKEKKEADEVEKLLLGVFGGAVDIPYAPEELMAATGIGRLVEEWTKLRPPVLPGAADLLIPKPGDMSDFELALTNKVNESLRAMRAMDMLDIFAQAFGDVFKIPKTAVTGAMDQIGESFADLLAKEIEAHPEFEPAPGEAPSAAVIGQVWRNALFSILEPVIRGARKGIVTDRDLAAGLGTIAKSIPGFSEDVNAMFRELGEFVDTTKDYAPDIQASLRRAEFQDLGKIGELTKDNLLEIQEIVERGYFPEIAEYRKLDEQIRDAKGRTQRAQVVLTALSKIAGKTRAETKMIDIMKMAIARGWVGPGGPGFAKVAPEGITALADLFGKEGIKDITNAQAKLYGQIAQTAFGEGRLQVVGEATIKQRYENIQATAKLSEQMKELAKRTWENKGVADEHSKAIIDQVSAAGDGGRAWKLFAGFFDEFAKEQEEGRKGSRRYGMMLSWFGYRLQSMGRLLMRWALAPFKQMINVLNNWERAMDGAATSLGYMAASGDLTAGRKGFLTQMLKDLPMMGIAFQGAFRYMTSAFGMFMAKAGDPLRELFLRIGDVFAGWDAGAFAQQISKLIPIMVQLVSTLLAMAERALPPFIAGLQMGLGTLRNMFGAIALFSDILTPFIGFLVGLSPLLIAFGSALFFIGPAGRMAAAGAGFFTKTLPGLVASARVASIEIRMMGFAQYMQARMAELSTMQMLKYAAVIGLAVFVIGKLIKGLRKSNKEMLGNLRESTREMNLATFDMTRNIVMGTKEIEFSIDEMGNVIDTSTGEIIGIYDAMKQAVVDGNGEIIYSFDTTDNTIKDSTGRVVGHFEDLGDGFTLEVPNIVGAIDTLTGEISDFFGDMQATLDTNTGLIKDENDKVVGYFDEASGKIFNTMTGAVADVETATNSMADAMNNLSTNLSALDFSGITNSVDEFSADFQDQMEKAAASAAAFGAIQLGVMYGKPLVGLAAAAGIVAWAWADEIVDAFDAMGESVERFKDDISYLGDFASDPLIQEFRMMAQSVEHLALMIAELGYEMEEAELIAKELWGQSIGDDIKKQMDIAVPALKGGMDALGGFMSPMGGGGVGGGTTQHITVHSTVVVENISGIADLELVEDAANRGVSEALRRRNWM